MNKRSIRIGTRESQLALWQARTVQQSLEEKGYSCELVPISSTGDQVLDQPLYTLGITGIFTKTLDVAMLNGQVDIAVHSMKDVPTTLPQGIVQAAVPPRATAEDILVLHPDQPEADFFNEPATIATGSLRRQAQWLHRYGHHEVVDLRGNVNTRLKKLKDSTWQGAIFAKAGLERIEVLPDHYINLDWMIPAPAQGAMMVVALAKDDYCLEACAHLNHSASEQCTAVEKQFLKTLEGGCTAPIGALATRVNGRIQIKGALLSLDGQTKIEVAKDAPAAEWHQLGASAAQEVLDRGGAEVMAALKKMQ
ncbi:hydroxymethylbilane synthase [Croceiramulus getboli]|nr:hydroxymethylbilane synthase [Flavobacteriaceae bacterium YJPT1-3]